uniref:Cdk5 and Abl enzyme substrate 2 n=1 Tax=Naja naja TaxID=35670 RepID=A0A8C6V7I2_NAJNA
MWLPDEPAAPRGASGGSAGRGSQAGRRRAAEAGRPLLPQQHLPGRAAAAAVVVVPGARQAFARAAHFAGPGRTSAAASAAPAAGGRGRRGSVGRARAPPAAAGPPRAPAGLLAAPHGRAGPFPRAGRGRCPPAPTAAGQPALPGARRCRRRCQPGRPSGGLDGGPQDGHRSPRIAQPHPGRPCWRRRSRRATFGGAEAKNEARIWISATQRLEKVHFIKNMRQYDTRNSRIVLICAKRTLCVAFSILPYGESLRISELRIEGQKQRHPSGGISATSEMVLGMEGVELGADGKVVSYAKFLYPTNALMGHKSDGISAISVCRASASRTAGGSRYKTSAAKTIPSTADLGNEVGELIEYNPNLLDDPQWPCGKHKRVLIFASYMTTVIEYVKPSDLKKDMNETFKEKFPHIKLTLSKIRSLKREMRTLSMECNLEPITVSMAYVYFEKLVLQGKLNKHNRKLCAGACVLLAAKISSDLRKHEVKHLIDKSPIALDLRQIKET